MTKRQWLKVLLGGFLIELALMVVAVALYSMLPDPTSALNIAVPPATLVVAVPIAMWVARSAPKPLFAGTATGLAALLLYGLLTLAAYLAAPERVDTSQTLGPAYLASHVLKIVGGALGGWWVARRRQAAGAAAG